MEPVNSNNPTVNKRGDLAGASVSYMVITFENKINQNIIIKDSARTHHIYIYGPVFLYAIPVSFKSNITLIIQIAVCEVCFISHYIVTNLTIY